MAGTEDVHETAAEQGTAPVQAKATGNGTDKQATRLSRVVEQVRSLSEDLVELVELKLQLVQVQLEERFESRINQIISKALVATAALAAVLFAMIAAAIGLGYLFHNQALGFLSIAVLLGILTFILWRGRFRFIDFSDNHEQPETYVGPGENVDPERQIPPHGED